MGKKLFNRSLQWKISFYIIFLILITINSVGWLFYYQSKKYFDEDLGEKLISVANSAAQLIDADLLTYLQPGSEKGNFYKSLQAPLKIIRKTFKLKRVYITDLSYKLLLDTNPNGLIGSEIPYLQSHILELKEAASGQSVYSTLYRGYNGELYKSAFAPLFNKENKIIAIACVDASPAFLKIIDDIQNFILMINAISLIIAVLLGLFLARSIVNPVKKLVAAAKRVSEGNYDSNVVIKTKDEIGFLGHVFNIMQSNIKINEDKLNSLRKEAEDEATYIKSYNELILQNIPTGILTIDLNGIVTVFNKEAKKILDINEKKCVDKHFSEIFNLNHPFRHLLDKYFTSALEEQLTEATLSLANRTVSLSIKIAPLFDPNNKLIGSNWLLVDLSEIKKLRTKIKEKERLAYLGELSAAIAHEIRNPLNSISLYLGILKRKSSEGSYHSEIINKIQNEIELLNDIVTNFLAFARPLQLKYQRFLIEELFEETVFLANDEITKRKIHIEYQIKIKNLELLGDIIQLKRAMLNIVQNAIEAMEPGGKLCFYANRVKSDGLLIIIEDNGRGINKNDLRNIFKPFFTTKHSGTGLGLAIVNNIIKAHSGKIFVRSIKAKGTKFYIYLPGKENL